MAERRPFLIRVDAAMLEAVERWAQDELRSLNGQIEFLRREALRGSGRWKGRPPSGGSGSGAVTGPGLEPAEPR